MLCGSPRLSSDEGKDLGPKKLAALELRGYQRGPATKSESRFGCVYIYMYIYIYVFIYLFAYLFVYLFVICIYLYIMCLCIDVYVCICSMIRGQYNPN